MFGKEEHKRKCMNIFKFISCKSKHKICPSLLPITSHYLTPITCPQNSFGYRRPKCERKRTMIIILSPVDPPSCYRYPQYQQHECNSGEEKRNAIPALALAVESFFTFSFFVSFSSPRANASTTCMNTYKTRTKDVQYL